MFSGGCLGRAITGRSTRRAGQRYASDTALHWHSDFNREGMRMRTSLQSLRTLATLRSLILGTLAISVFGTAIAQSPSPRSEAPTFKVGDRWKSEQRDRRTGLKESDWVRSITAVSATQIEGLENDGKLVMTPELAVIESPTVIISGEAKALSFPLEVGKKWDYKYSFRNKVSGVTARWQLESSVVAHEKVKVPAGEFDAFKIQARGFWNNESTGRNGRMQITHWYAPTARAIVKTEYEDGFNNWVREVTEFQLQP